MTKRITALLLCLLMLMTLPISAFASETDAAASSPASVRYISSGSITFGTATLYDSDGNALPLEYVYSPRVTMSGSTSKQLTEMLQDCGFSLPAMQFDYQLMNMQNFFTVRVTDGQALARIIDAMVTRANEDDGAAVSSSDAPVSGTDADVSSSDLSGTDADAVLPAEDDAPAQNVTTSLHTLLFGAASFEVYSTLEESLAAAFPEFTFASPEAVAFPESLNSVAGVAVDPDGMTAQVTVTPEPEYVEREVFGEVFQVLMVSSVAYRYEIARYDISGAADGAVIPEKTEEPVVSPSDTTAETTASTTTTTATTTTTTTEEESTAQTTTTTAAATATTTAANDDDNDGYPCEGVVSTKWKRLNVRTGPGLEYKIIEQLDKGTLVTVIDHEDGWYRIALADGTEGWCTDEYITLK